MAEPRGRSTSAPRLLKILLLTVAGLAVAFLVVRAAAPRVLPPSLSQTIAEEPTNQLFRAAERELLNNRGSLPQATYARVMEAAVRAPVAGEPFMFAAVRALEAGDLRTGEDLMTLARARNPRRLHSGCFASVRPIGSRRAAGHSRC